MKEMILSVIVPIYNGESYLERLLKNIQKQEFPYLELILVDDGSVDATYSICQVYEKQYPWVKVIHTENKGVSHARNCGIAIAQGTWIQFFDVDDILYKNMFRDFFQVIREHQVELVVCSCFRRYLETKKTEQCGPKKDEIVTDASFKALFRDMTMETRYWLLDYVWNKWYRRDILESQGLRFDEALSLGEDFVFNTQYFSNIHTVALRKNIYYQYLVNESGLASRFLPKPWEVRMKHHRAHRNLYEALDILKYEEMQIGMQTGRIGFGDIRMVSSKRCTYTEVEKLYFVESMIESELFPLILDYLKSQKSLPFRMYYVVFRTKHAHSILKMIYLEKSLRQIKEQQKKREET